VALTDVVIIHDAHEPWSHSGTVEAIIADIKRRQPKVIVDIGDQVDAYSLSRYARSHNILTPADEFKRARDRLETRWKRIHEASPRSDCFLVSSNHGDRLRKRVLDRLPEAESLVDFEFFTRFAGVTYCGSSFARDNILFEHGYLSGLGSHVRYNLRSTVHGHTHQGGVYFLQRAKQVIWELDVGFCGDPKSPIFDYRSQVVTSRWTLGWGVIDDLGPRFIPYNGR
jgi:hypothetical protein